jgi:hypothetical protein
MEAKTKQSLSNLGEGVLFVALRSHMETELQVLKNLLESEAKKINLRSTLEDLDLMLDDLQNQVIVIRRIETALEELGSDLDKKELTTRYFNTKLKT